MDYYSIYDPEDERFLNFFSHNNFTDWGGFRSESLLFEDDIRMIYQGRRGKHLDDFIVSPVISHNGEDIADFTEALLLADFLDDSDIRTLKGE